jgi:polysaccharide deacetylase 2 family uncharacterized protein YibQ
MHFRSPFKDEMSVIEGEMSHRDHAVCLQKDDKLDMNNHFGSKFSKEEKENMRKLVSYIRDA